MAGIIVADTIQSGGSFIRLNSASQTVATINAAGIYANTGNLLIAANGTIGVATITNTAITGTITQAQIGSGVSATGPSFSAGAGSTQSISSGVWTKIQVNTEEWDTASCYDNATNYRFTPNVAGYYQVNAGLFISPPAGSTSGYILLLYKNGGEHILLDRDQFEIYFNQLTSGSAIVHMNGTTDYIEIFIWQNSGDSLTFGSNGAPQNYFQAILARRS